MRTLSKLLAGLLFGSLCLAGVEVTLRRAGYMAHPPGFLTNGDPAPGCFPYHDRVRVGPPPLPDLTRTRVLCVGDSWTFGYGISEAESYPFQLEERLNLRRPAGYKVYSCGIPGQGSAQVAAMLPVLLGRYRPALVVLFLGMNDDNRTPPNHPPPYACEATEVASDIEEKRLDLAPTSVQLAGLEKWRAFLLIRSIALWSRGLRWGGSDAETLPGSGSLLPNLGTIRRHCEAAGAQLLLLNYPAAVPNTPLHPHRPSDMRPLRRLVAGCARELELPLVDLEPAFQAPGGDECFLDWMYTSHPSPAGCRRIADAVAGWVEENLTPPPPGS